MAPDREPPPRRPVSRARDGGGARPVGDKRAATPPSFAPAGGGRGRPRPAADEPIVVGDGPVRRPARPRASSTVRPAEPAARPAEGRSARSATPPSIVPAGRGPATGRPAARHPEPQGAPPPSARRTRGGRRGRRTAATVVVVLLVLVLAWPIGLAIWADGRLSHVEALSDGPGTPGATYLLAGSDSRADGFIADPTEGARTDTIMLLHDPASGPAALISLPRDAYVEIPGHGMNKLNAAYTFGGPPLLVQTVEVLTGITVDHYVEIGFGGVAGVVDAIGGTELCLDYAVSDELSGLVWDEPGCRVADGTTALAFARMRYSDPKGDIGRAERQQQLISSLASGVADPGVLVSPGRQVDLVRAGTDALTVSEGTGVLDLGRLALAFRAATGPDGVRGTPWLTSLDHRPGGVGSAVLLDADRNAELWPALLAGDVPPGPVGGVPGG